MSQQTDAMLGRYHEEFEDPNAGVEGPEPAEAGPGVMGKILTTFSHVKGRVSGSHSAPTTPSGVQAQQHHERTVGRDFEGVPEELSPPDQVHNNAVGLDTAGAGDGVEKTPVGGLSTGGGISRSVESAGSRRGDEPFIPDAGTPASPKVPHKDLGERIIDKLPGSHMNPYSLGVVNPPRAANPYAEGDRSAAPTSPSVQRSSAPSSPSILGRLKNVVTGQKLSQGTATENATTGTAGTAGEQQKGYAQSPTPEEGGGPVLEKVKQRFGNKGPDVGSAETWPSPAVPDISSIPSATRTDAEGKPIEGPTRPRSEDIKNEGLMSKLLDKLHKKSTSPRATTAADIGTSAPPTADISTSAPPTASADTRPSQETGLPTHSEEGPEPAIGTATGPTEH